MRLKKYKRTFHSDEYPWIAGAAEDLPNEALARLLEDIADDAEKAPDRTISAVGLADILLAVSDRLK